jgi:adsorption protein B
LPLEAVIRHRVLAQGVDGGGRAILLTASPHGDEVIEELTRALGQPVAQQIVRESEIATGLRVLRDEPEALLPGAARVPLIGDLLIELGHVTRERFNEALQVYRPDLDGRIGDFMMARGVITAGALNAAIQAQAQARESGGLAT